MGYMEKFTTSVIQTFVLWCCTLVREVSSDACAYKNGGTTSYVYCEHGCCGTETTRTCCSYKLSTSVLIVACVISGLVVVALIAAVIICCYKNYKDKQQSRVRAIHQEQTRNIPVRPAEPPKPPSYIESPPDYSEEMPDSHYRPRTAALSNTPYNTRFNGRQSNQNSSSQSRNTQRNGIGPAPVYTSSASGSLAQPPEQVPSFIFEAPPRYSSLEHVQSIPNNNNVSNRHRRFIRTPEIPNESIIEEESTILSRNDTESTTTRETSTAPESRMQTRASTRIPQRVQNLQNDRQPSEMSVSSTGVSRMATRSTANAGRNRNTTLSDIEDLEINALRDI